ncbi:hypothetical protein F4818DRAFT_238838 [Hypoxylon cercidicola]|nr:hypothetical protein F4818DRAFT_238838 [Hypoxylon cercidicola]
MPALTSALLLNNIAGRNESLNAATSLASNATENVIQVVCAWPVSGQYGPGSRILYYALVAACVFARKAEWLRNACLAAALIFPAVAALHSIVLAVMHTDRAVDMDVYGAFQFCSIGILAAPLTVRLSRTYFYDPGRNIIFLWTGVVLAGLLSLTVEFFRVNSSSCNYDLPGFPTEPSDFDHLTNICGIPCSIQDGPSSPLRQGSANEIAIIPAPGRLTFNAATLVAAACCIPAVLSLVSMWNKILEINWKSRFGREDEDQLIEGTNGATVERINKVNTVIRLFLSTLEIPLFSGAVLAILIVGEMNLFSHEVQYQTEPMSSIGQWAPILGTGLAALGSLYLLLAADLDAVEEEDNQKLSTHHCNFSHHHIEGGNTSLHEHPGVSRRPSSLGSQSIHSHVIDSPERDPSRSPAMQQVGLFDGPSHSVASLEGQHLRPGGSDSGRETSSERMSTASRLPVADVGHRRKVAKALLRVSDYLGTASQDRFDDSEFKHGKALDFPEVPAEEMRNKKLPQIRETYNQHREDESASKRPSRSGSVTGSVYSRPGDDGSAIMSRTISAPCPPSPMSRSSSPSPTPLGVQHVNTLPTTQSSFDPEESTSSSAGPTRGRPRERRDTLQVPVETHQSSLRNTQSVSSAASITTTTVSNGTGSPVIVISHDPDSPTEEIPSLNAPTTSSSPEPASSSKTTTSPP